MQRQALAGMLWSKQFYYFDVRRMAGRRPGAAAAARSGSTGATATGAHLNNADIISMPDKWEYPWYAAWDLAFHSSLGAGRSGIRQGPAPAAAREWYMHPNGQLPAYEWAFGDVNPPVQAWAACGSTNRPRATGGVGDFGFLERVFQKLMLNFTWWVNRKDAEGRNIFQGGFLGLDNIGLFDRSSAAADRWIYRPVRRHRLDGDVLPQHVPHRGRARPARPRLRGHGPKFFEHFLYIADAMTGPAAMASDCGTTRTISTTISFFMPDGSRIPLRMSSMVG